jgi:alkylation response protein AidB-like acyl-CoA dehydrogenase
MVLIGIARSALHDFEARLLDKVAVTSSKRLAEKSAKQIDLAKAEALIESGRSYVLKTTAEMWEAVDNGEELTIELRRRVRLASCAAAASAAKAVDLIFNAGGASSISLQLPFQRYWRDVHAACQHFQVSQNNFEAMGRLRLTGELEGPL